MKRLICVFTIIISFFIFDFSFKEKSWDEYVTGKDFILNIQEKTNSKLVSVNFEVDSKNKDILFDELLNFADENNYGLIASTSENLTNYNELQSVYLYPSNNKKITDLYTIKELNAIDFSREGKEYITTDLSDMNSSHHIYYLDQEYNNTYNDVLNIYPMENYQLTTDYENKQQMYFIFIIDNIEDFTNEVNSSKLVDYLPNDYADNGLSEIHGQVDLKENSFIAQRIIVVTALTILLLLICLFIKNRKEIILRKQYGMSNHYIVLKMFVPIVLLIALVYSITQIICYGLYIGNFYRNGIDFILFILKYYVGVILLLVLILVVLYFMVRNIRDINFIKREKLSDKKIVNTNLVAKLIVVLLLLQPTVTEIISGINNTRLYNVLEDNEEKFSNLIYLFGINTMQDSKSNEGAKYMEYRSKMLNYFNEHGGYFQVFDYEVASTIMSEEIPELMQLPFPYLEVNNNYILDYELLDENGNKVDINQLDDEALLVPLTYKDEDLSMYIGTQIIYIQEGYEFYRHDVPISYDTYIKYNPIIKVYKEIPFDNNFSSSPIAVQLPIRSKKDIDNLETYLIDEGLKDKVHFGSFQKDYEIIRQKTINQLQQTVIMIIIQLFAIFMFVFETIYLIIYQEKKLYALRYLNGENFIERYGELFLMNLMIYVISLLFGLFIYQIEVIVLLIFLGVLTVFELIIIYIMVKRFEKKSIAATLKGE